VGWTNLIKGGKKNVEESGGGYFQKKKSKRPKFEKKELVREVLKRNLGKGETLQEPFMVSRTKDKGERKLQTLVFKKERKCSQSWGDGTDGGALKRHN